jgi:hypothetical protein
VTPSHPPRLIIEDCRSWIIGVVLTISILRTTTLVTSDFKFQLVYIAAPLFYVKRTISSNITLLPYSLSESSLTLKNEFFIVDVNILYEAPTPSVEYLKPKHFTFLTFTFKREVEMQ